LEVKKLIDSGIVKEEHPDCEAISFLSPRRMERSRFASTFTINVACPKGEEYLTITDLMIDNTCGFERMSFKDGFSGYNQINLYPESKKHTSFKTPLGMYY